MERNLFPFLMAMILWKVHYNTACAENTEKRVESQVKLHRIIAKVNKIICFNHTKISIPPKFCGPTRLLRSMPKFDSRHPRFHIPTPPTLFKKLVKLM